MMIKYITLLIAIITLTGCSQQLGSLPVVEDSKVTVIELSTTEKISKDGIEKVLKDKTQVEKVNLKSKELAKVKLGKFKKDNLDIEIIGDIKEIDGGIELFAKAWKDGKQLGFGKDGTVEIERFRFFNPPILIDDENGEILREWEETDIKTGLKIQKQRKLKYDPEEAIKQDLAHTILQVAKDGKNIIKGKIGNTTSTFYPAAGENEPVDGVVGSPNSVGSWANVHDLSSGSFADDTSSNSNVISCYVWTGGSYQIMRGFFLFDTSPLGAGADIDSATFSLYVTGKSDQDNDANAFMSVVQSSPASTDELVVGDFDQCGSISNPTEGIDSGDRADITSISTSAYLGFDLNATGLGWISKTSITKLGTREGHDILNSAITSSSPNTTNSVAVYMSDQTGTTSDPKLVVEHSEAVSRRIINIE